MRFLKGMLKFLLGSLIALLSLSLLAGSFLLLVLFKPQWFIHEKSLRWSSEHILRPMGINVEFASLEPSFSQDDFYMRHLTLKSRDLRIQTETLDLLIPVFSAALSFDLHPSRLALTSIGPLELLGGELDLRGSPPEPDSEPFRIERKWLEQLRALSTAPIHVVFKTFSFTPYQEPTIDLPFEARLARNDASGLWHLEVDVKDFSLVNQSIYADVPTLKAAVDFTVEPEQGLVLRTLGPLQVDAKEVRVTVAPAAPNAPPPPKSSSSLPSSKWFEQLKDLEILPSTILVKRASLLRPGEKPMSVSAELKLGQTKAQALKLEMKVNGTQGLPLRRAQLALDLNLPGGEQLLPLSSTLRGQADLDSFGQAALDGSLVLASLQEGRYELNARYRYGPSRFAASSKGILQNGDFTVSLDGDASALHERLPKAGVERCSVKGHIEQEKAPFLASQLSCRITLTRSQETWEKNYQELLPRSFSFDVLGPISIPAWNEDPSFSAPLKIALLPMKGDYFQLNSVTALNLGGRLFGGAAGVTGTVDLDTALLLPNFQNLVQRFRRSPFAVPAPFATLEGLMRCDMKGRIRIQGVLVHMPFSCATQLDSSTQTLWIAANGLIETRSDRKPLIQATIGLDKITLELPKISIDEPIPQLLPDKRIMEVKDADLKVASEPLPVELDLSIKTPDGRPLKLATQLAKVPVPISIDLAIKGDAPLTTGSIAVERYEVSFMKRKAYVERLAMRLDANADIPPQLDGFVIFKDPNFRINLKLSGTIDRPFYAFESTPPRSQSEIISIILFGGDADSLDVDSQRSVEDTRAAMVDGAIGLVSMYYLASTPIESVGYNAHTGLFRARVRLGQTLSLMVGSDLGGANQSIGFRKRLTENWSFETTAQTDEETKSNHGIAMFRWGRRY